MVVGAIVVVVGAAVVVVGAAVVVVGAGVVTKFKNIPIALGLRNSGTVNP